MTGTPMLQLLVRDANGLYPSDSDRAGDVILADGWTVTRGRSDEFDDADPTQARWTLDNDDATYSPGPGGLLAPGTWVRLQVVVDGQTFVRFTGPIDAMPLTWPSPTGNMCEIPVEAIDTQRMLADADEQHVLGGNLIDEVLYDPARPLLGGGAPGVGPAALQYVPLSDPEGDTAATVYGPPAPGKTRATLQSTALGRADLPAPVFAGSDNALPDPEATTTAALAGDQWLSSPTPLVGGASLMVAWRTDDPSDGVSSLLAGVTAQPGSGRPHVFLAIRSGQLVLLHYGPDETRFTGAGMTSTRYVNLTLSAVLDPGDGWSPCDGRWHVAVVRYDTGTARVHLDAQPATPVTVATGLGSSFRLEGTLVIGGVDPALLYTPDVMVPLSHNVTPFTGCLAQVAVHAADQAGAAINATRAADLVTALRGHPHDGARDRVARLLRLAGVAFDPAASDPGVLTDVPGQATAGRAVWECVDDVADAEGGLAFIDPATGAPVLQGRTRRVYAATAPAPAAALESDDIEHDDLRVEVGGRKAPVPSFGLLVETDQRRIDGEAWFRARPDRPRLSQFTVDLLTLGADKVRAILALRIGDRIDVAGLPVQAPFSPAELIVEGWSERCSVSGDSAEWSITFNTVAAADSRAWRLGHPVWGRLGATTKLHY